ncbi:MAG: manganese catalase family protein [Alistipes sp.]|nr:manganese catalase family protein [Alistipes sp.]
MFYHAKELQYKARVSRPDPRFAGLLLEQFGGGNGELSACMQYFLQSFACRRSHPEIYDLLMDIASEELGHLEMVGATIQMLLAGVSGHLKDAADQSDIFADSFSKEDFIHQAFTVNPQFGVVSGGGPTLTNSTGAPWTAAYVNANGDLTVDLRSNIAAESRAKMVYEYLMQFTDDKYVQETLNYLMTREVAHFQQFEAALMTIRPNFPPGILQSDPRYSNIYSKNSLDEKGSRGPWNEGRSTGFGEEWQYIADPRIFARATNGLTEIEPEGTDRTTESVRKADKELSKRRSQEIRHVTPLKEMSWCCYGHQECTVSTSKDKYIEQL